MNYKYLYVPDEGTSSTGLIGFTSKIAVFSALSIVFSSSSELLLSFPSIGMALEAVVMKRMEAPIKKVNLSNILNALPMMKSIL